MTTTDININSAAYRADQRPRIIHCDYCGCQATRRLRRTEGTATVTANTCRICVPRFFGREPRYHAGRHWLWNAQMYAMRKRLATPETAAALVLAFAV